ncbi:MAG: DUF4129 domain-containing protein [Armatimonadota bacterium]
MRFRVILCAIVAAGFWALISTPGSAESASHYVSRLSAVSRSLNSAIDMERRHPGSGAGVLKQIYGSIPGQVSVSAPDGQVIKVDFGSLRADLREAMESSGKSVRVRKLGNVQERVSAMQSSAEGINVMKRRDASDARATLGKILARAEYQPSRQEELLQRIAQFIRNLFKHMSVPSGVADVVSWVVLAAAAVIFVIVLVILAMKLLAMQVSREPKPQTQVVHPVKSSVQLNSVIEAAEREAAAGHYREAFRNIYLATIMILDRAKLVKYTEGVTNWEYLSALKRNGTPEAVDTFRPMTLSFDELIYGKRDVSQQDYLQCMQRYKALEEML